MPGFAPFERDLVDDDGAEGAEPVFGDSPFSEGELLSVYQDDQGDIVTAICAPSGLIGYVSPSCLGIFGWSPADLIGRRLADFVHPEDLRTVVESRRDALRATTHGLTTFRMLRGDGSHVWTEAAFRRLAQPRGDGTVLLVVTLRDTTDAKIANDIVHHQALTDPLTGIPNRTAFMDRLEQALLHLTRTTDSLAVIYLDLDRFKVINDSLGHEIGDQLLVKAAARLSRTIRPEDTLARIGGDEFVVIAGGLGNPAEANLLAARLCTCMEIPFEIGTESIVCTTSAGLVTTSDSGYSALGLLQEADLALYQAKDKGRNCFEIFDEGMRSDAIVRLQTEQRIRSALAENRFLVHYQPIIEIATGRVVRVEALARIQEHDELVFPAVFIEVAQETGLLVVMDEFVMRHALAQAGEWARDAGVDTVGRVSINVTGRHLSDSRFVESILQGLRENGLEPASLAVEVVEQVLMEASTAAMASLRTLREQGVTVGIDDFGTGYSSLAYLRQFPLDFLKIDQYFVHQLQVGAEGRAVVTAIIELAHALELVVVAEGVETEDQLETLARLGCDQVQGFLLGRGESAGSASSIFQRRKMPAARR